MSVPAVAIQRLDNQIGVLVNRDGDYLAAVGNCSGGTLALNTPATVARKSDIATLLGGGRLAEAAAFLIDETGKPVVVCATDKTTDGACGSITQTGTGTSVASATTGVHPIDDYEVLITVVTGGVVGTGPINYTYSLDGGRNTSPLQALGTATTIVLPGSIGVSLDLTHTGSVTLVAGDTISFRTTGPVWNDAQLATALTALKTTSQKWRGCLIVGDVTGTGDVGVLDAAGVAMENLGKERYFVWGFRVPAIAESETTYAAAFNTAFGTVNSSFCIPAAGACEIQSPVSQRRYLRPVSWVLAMALIKVRPGVDVAATKLGPLPPTINIFDARGNPKHHDERYNPGLDDMRASTLRTWEELPGGIYINNARVMSPPGSDLQFAQHLRCIGIACETVRAALVTYASDDLLTDPGTGFLLEQECVDIEVFVRSKLKQALVDPKDVSAASYTQHRDDDVLSTFTLNGDARIVPKAYPKQLNSTVGLYKTVSAPVGVQS